MTPMQMSDIDFFTYVEFSPDTTLFHQPETLNTLVSTKLPICDTHYLDNVNTYLNYEPLVPE